MSSRRSFCKNNRYWQGDAILLNVNDRFNAIIPSRFTRFELCLPQKDVDVTNDRFQLQSTGDNSACITSFQLNGTQIFLGPEDNQTLFWIDENQSRCDKQQVVTKEITVQNGQVISSECKGIPMTTSTSPTVGTIFTNTVTKVRL